MILLFSLLIIFLLNTGAIRAVNISLAANSVFVFDDLYKTLVNNFNRYSEKQELDIHLDMVLFSDLNTTYALDEYGSTIESLLLKKSDKYDIFCYDPVYNYKYKPNVFEIKKIFEKYNMGDHLNLYNKGDAVKTCTLDGDWIGLPLFEKYSILFSNKSLLDKHNKPVPETWKELVETGKYIYEKEKEENNIIPIIYNGFFSDLNAFTSYYEFIYSFRKNPETVFQGFDNDEAVEAIKYLKYIKEEISSDDIFKGSELMALNSIFSGEGLFIRYWDFGMPTPNSYQTPSPGSKKGVNINTSLVSGMNLGINKYIPNEERIKAAVEVVKYFTSEEVQRELIVKTFNLYTAISDFYDDEEICSILSCPLVKSARSVTRVLDESFTNEYMAKVTNILNNYLFGSNSTAEATIKEIVDIQKIYNFSIKSTIGGIMFGLLITTTIFIMGIFLIFIQNKSSKSAPFFSPDLYWMYCIGNLLIIGSELLKFGKLSNLKCQMGLSMFFVGLSFCYIPILYKLIVSFPNAENKLKRYCQVNKIKFLACCIFIELVLNLIFIASPFSVENKIFNDTNVNKNYNRCTMKNAIGNIVVLIELLVKFFVIITVFLLSFCEWNVLEIYNDVRSLVISVYINSLLLILYVVIIYVPLNKYEIIYTISSLIILIMALSNYTIVNLIKLLIIKNTHKIGKEELSNIKTNSTIKSDVKTNSSKSSNTFIGKIIDYHYTPYSTTSECVVNSSPAIRSSYLVSNNTNNSANYSFDK